MWYKPHVPRSQTFNVGTKILAARKRAGLSHDKLGAAVGTSRQHLIRLEKGAHVPREGMLARIAEATGQPLSFFEGATEDDDEESDPVADLMLAIRRVVRAEVQAVRA